MRLTHIKLAGFKSFTDPTTIHVPGQLVAVIGPNGCGKSNVIDAVRWVLGEASAKQLRGESMQDVIFNGAATRRPAPRASVELVFDNSDHSLQGVWGQYAEVSIKRQLTRQGESGYFINGQPVRRRDITDLFLGTGVGTRGYAVIEQGMISRIIEARPEELRAYIEESAGVSKYKERRRETESRLNDTREHLQRLADLQSELARQVEKLEKQAAEAARYQALNGDLQRAQDLLDYTQWQQSLAAADTAAAQHDTARTAQQHTEEQAQQVGAELHRLRETEQAQQAEQHTLTQRHALLREQIARLEEQIRSRQQQRQRAEREQTAAQAALQKIAAEQSSLNEEHALLQEELDISRLHLSELAVEVGEHELRLPELEADWQQSQAALHNQQDELNRLRRELALKRHTLQHNESSLKTAGERRVRLEQEQAALDLPPDDETAAAQQAAAELAAQYEAAEAAVHEAETLSGSLKTRLHTAQQTQQKLFKQQLALEAEQQALATLLAAADTAPFWQGSNEADAPVLWQQLHAPEEWRQALAAVLADRLHARAVTDGFTPPEPLPPGAAAWCAAPVSGSLKTKSQPAQALIHQIRAEAPFQAAVQYWLDGVLCAPNLAYALAHRHELQPGQIWLTPEGHRTDRVGTVLHATASQPVEQQNRSRELTRQLAALAPALSDAETELADIQAACEQAESSLKNAHGRQRAIAADWQAAQSRAGTLLARTNQGQLRRDHIVRELAALADETEQTRFTCDTLQQDIAEAAEAAAELERRQQHLADDSRSRQHALKQAQLALLEANRRHGTAEITVHKQQQQSDSLHRQLDHLARQQNDWQQRQSELLLDSESDDGEEQRIRLEELAESELNLQDHIRATQNRLADTQQQGHALYERQQSLAAALPALQAATQTALLQQQEALINAKRFHDSLLERGSDIDALARTAAAFSGSLKELQSQISSLQQTIVSLGAVNLAALEELAEVRERDGYYRSQSEDVCQAIALLEEAIAQIDNETKARFKTTFDAVNEKVQSFFPTLFGGGEAQLTMSSDDLLNAGVSIMARPPGKKNATIHLLSGGEKALTAMSLVFALFSLNPAPFCLLDEVDAPLDDANTGRFCNLVKEMSAQTQFLYISHNRLTMEMAEQLIGVTMQEKGVSRIVAVDIKQALDMAEAA